MEDNQQPRLDFKQLKEDSDYLIYSDGRLFSKKTNRFLKGKIDNVGYQVYSLAITDKLSVSGRRLQKMMYAHRLVAEYFIPNPNNYPYVHHKDENKLNNNVDNLEWISAQKNAQEHIKNGIKERRPPKYHLSDLPNEVWRIFPENETYSISSKGRIKNNKTNKLLYLDECQKYTRIQLGKKHYYVHRLVYCVFNNDYDLDDFVIDHIDGDPRNNSLENLQKITQQENCLKQARFND